MIIFQQNNPEVKARYFTTIEAAGEATNIFPEDLEDALSNYGPVYFREGATGEPDDEQCGWYTDTEALANVTMEA